MANALIVQSRSNGFVDGLTRYVQISGGSNVTNSNIAWCEVPVRDAGVFSNMFVYVVTNTASVTSTITLQDSQVDTALTVSYTSDQTGIKEDTSNTATFAATDKVQWVVVVPAEAGTNTLTTTLIGVQ